MADRRGGGVDARRHRGAPLTRLPHPQGWALRLEPTYRVRIRLQGREPVTRAFHSSAEAVSWRKDAQIALRRGRDVDQGGRKMLRGQHVSEGCTGRPPRALI
jgi:hypothetical protein